MKKRQVLLMCVMLFFFVANAQDTKSLCCEDAEYGEKVTDLEEALKNPETVKFLDLNMQHPKLTAIPREVTQLPNLVCLNVSFNRVGSFPVNFTNLHNLVCLDLSGNHYLSKLPDFLNEMPNLKVIKMEDFSWSQAKKEETEKKFPNITFIW